MSEEIFIYPTDTVWGIGGNIHVAGMAQKINRVKGYDEIKPLSVLFYNLDMLCDYFQLELVDREWLEAIFTMEATLGLPVSWLKKDIPKEVYEGSVFICVRVLNYPCIQELIEKAEGPVFTTSFNLKNTPPLVLKSEVDELKKNLCPDGVLINGESPLSGQSSTIAVLNEKMDFRILRAGTRVCEIEEHIKLLTT